jgi:hypothetical protein
MILTSVCENSEFIGQSDYDLSDVRKPSPNARPPISANLASSRRHQPRFDVALIGVGLFGWGHEDGRALG